MFSIKLKQARLIRKKLFQRKKGLKKSAIGKMCREKAIEKLTGMGVAIDQIVEELTNLMPSHCVAGPEIQKAYGISPCVLMSEMNDRGLIAACEMDVCSAVCHVGSPRCNRNSGCKPRLEQ